MLSLAIGRPHATRRTRSSLLVGFALVGAALTIVPSASADPASGPGAVSQATAGGLAPGVIPDGTCAARVTAVGGGGASSPVSTGLGGTGGAGASITATFDVLPGQSFQGSVGGGGGNPTGGTGDGSVGLGGTGGTIVVTHRGGGGGGRTSVDLAGSTVVVAGAGGGGGGSHQPAPAGVGGGGGFTGIAAGTVAPGSNGQTGVDIGATASGGVGGQAAAGGAGGVNTASAAANGAAGGGIGVGTGGNGGPDVNYDSAGGGGGGYTGGGGGASTINQNVSGAGGGGGSSWVSSTSPTVVGSAPTAVSGEAGTASPAGGGPGATGSLAIDWLPCLYGLSVAKSVSPTSVDAGGAVTWTVTITNDGPDPMTRGDTVDLTDLLPAGSNGAPGPAFEVLTFAVAGGTNPNMSSGPVTCSGLTVGSSMPAATTCSRAYSAPSAPGAPSGGLRGLDPGETITITYRQIIANTAACSTITNTASVVDRATTSGTTDVVGVTAAQSDDASLTIDCYDLAVTKVASPSAVRAGDTITWTITVTNNGPADMEGPTATDANPLVVTDVFPSGGVGLPTFVSASGPAGSCGFSAGTVTCAAGLPNGGAEILTFTQVVDSGAADGSVIANTATVTDPPTGDTDDSSTDQATVGVPTLSLAKTADPVTYAAVGDVIDYEFLVTNTGTASVDGPVTVTDDKTTVTCPSATSLDPGDSVTCTSSHTITLADLDAGSITNTASASADGITSGPDSATVTATQGPALSLAKSADPSTYSAVGDVIAYTFILTNSGNVTLSGPFTVSDDQSTDESCPATASLDPGDSITCTASSTITQADLDAGSLTNVASATNDTVTSNEDSATVTSSQAPALSLAKSADPMTYSAVGDVIDYAYVLTNTGNVALSGPFTVSDDQSTDEGCPATASLDPGDSITCTASSTITQADLDAGSLTNVASATNGTVTSNEDSATVTAAQGPGLALVKTGDPTTFEAVGDVIAYDYVVTNTGNVALAGPVTVTDDKTTATCPDLTGVGDLDTDLDPAESVTCTSTYTITQADIDADAVTNTATASAGGVDSAVESETVTVVGAPTPRPTRAPTPPPTDTEPAVARSSPADTDPMIAVSMLLAITGLFAVLAVQHRRNRRVRER